jgi:hypothetical protein
MKRLLLFTISTVAIASDSYHEIFEHFTEDREIRKKCIGSIEKYDGPFNFNFPDCKKIADYLHAIKENTKPYNKWDQDLHIPVAKLLQNNKTFIAKEFEHKYVEGIAKFFSKKSWYSSKTPYRTKRYALHYALKSNPGIAQYFANRTTNAGSSWDDLKYTAAELNAAEKAIIDLEK